jgi:hypothetical protein
VEATGEIGLLGFSRSSRRAVLQSPFAEKREVTLMSYATLWMASTTAMSMHMHALRFLFHAAARKRKTLIAPMLNPMDGEAITKVDKMDGEAITKVDKTDGEAITKVDMADGEAIAKTAKMDMADEETNAKGITAELNISIRSFQTMGRKYALLLMAFVPLGKFVTNTEELLTLSVTP